MTGFKTLSKKILAFLLIVFVLGGCRKLTNRDNLSDWDLSIVPSSVRVDPVAAEIIDNRFDAVPQKISGANLIKKNWIFDGQQATLHAARGEYISFQLVLTNNSTKVLENIIVEMEPFKYKNEYLKIAPELFLEWSVKVQTPSGGYPKSSLGKGWYPDALIPFKNLQLTEPSRRWIYPLQLPDFNNRIENQKSLIIWVDQYVPFDKDDAKPGTYSSIITVKIQDQQKHIPVNLTLWDFAIPNENKFRASLQHEGFLALADENIELQLYQLLKKHRLSVMEPIYKPELNISENGEVNVQWDEFDSRLEKYFTGKAFTKDYHYDYGPGYGEPVENFLLPFDVYGKHGTSGWPDVGNPDVERNPENMAIYISTINQFRKHLLEYIDPEKTMLTVYLNGLDESYFPDAWHRMVYYGDLFKKYFPESYFRIDGAYEEEAMETVRNSISSWGSHTINYNSSEVKKYRESGIKDWIYGSMIYESGVNSWVGSSTYIDLPLVNERAISWATFKYDAYSWLSWGIGAGWKAAWYDPETWKDYRDDRDERQEQKILNGNGCLLYAPNIIPNVNVACPSIRLKNMRNGIQEYEYLTLLRSLTPDSDEVMDIVNGIINEPFGRNSIGIIDVWSFNAEEWDQVRIQIGNQINSLISNVNNI